MLDLPRGVALHEAVLLVPPSQVCMAPCPVFLSPLPVQGCVIASQQGLSCLHQALIHQCNQLQYCTMARPPSMDCPLPGLDPPLVLQQQLSYVAYVAWLACCRSSPKSAFCGVQNIQQRQVQNWTGFEELDGNE